MLAALQLELAAGRALLWEDVARRVGVLLQAPAAFSGEHFVQVRSRKKLFWQAKIRTDSHQQAELRSKLVGIRYYGWDPFLFVSFLADQSLRTFC